MTTEFLPYAAGRPISLSYATGTVHLRDHRDGRTWSMPLVGWAVFAGRLVKEPHGYAIETDIEPVVIWSEEDDERPNDRASMLTDTFVDGDLQHVSYTIELADRVAPVPPHPRETREDTLTPTVLAYVAEHPGASGRQITAGVTGTAQNIRDTLATLERNGQVVTAPGRGGGKAYTIADPA